MKKVLIILLIVLGSIALLYIANNTINLKKSKIDLVNEVVVDLSTSKIYEFLSIKEGSPVTYFFQDKGPDVDSLRKHFLKEYNIELPEFSFDFVNYYMAISIGRKITDIKYYLSSFNRPSYIKSAHITFDSTYSEGRVYIYQMDKVHLENEFLDGNHYYIMDGSKRLYVGRTIIDINR